MSLNITPRTGCPIVYNLSRKNYRVLSWDSDQFGTRWFRIRDDRKASVLIPEDVVFVSQWKFD